MAAAVQQQQNSIASSSSANSAYCAPTVPAEVIEADSAAAAAEFDRTIGAPVADAELASSKERRRAATQTSYATIAKRSEAESSSTSSRNAEGENEEEPVLCPYHIVDQCFAGDNCQLVHGELCIMCDIKCLHPTNERQRKRHLTVRLS